MTIAVCFTCGHFKQGAWTVCSHCGVIPRADEDIALSLAMTDHYFDPTTLKSMGDQIAAGEKVQLDPETHQNLLQQIRASSMAPMLKMLKRQSKPKSPWWKFW